jgi:hypothetical protein
MALEQKSLATPVIYLVKNKLGVSHSYSDLNWIKLRLYYIIKILKGSRYPNGLSVSEKFGYRDPPKN